MLICPNGDEVRVEDTGGVFKCAVCLDTLVPEKDDAKPPRPVRRRRKDVTP